MKIEYDGLGFINITDTSGYNIRINAAAIAAYGEGASSRFILLVDGTSYATNASLKDLDTIVSQLAWEKSVQAS